MRRILALVCTLLWAGLAYGQTTTTFNGIVKDLTQTPVPTGQVLFTLRPSRIDTTISGNARFISTTTTCEIHNPSVMSTSGTGTITVVVGAAQNWQVGDSILFFGTADATLNANTVASPYAVTAVNSATSYNFTQAGTHTHGAGGIVGGLYASGGTGACKVKQNTAITPANTSYNVGLWPIFSLTSSFNTYAIGSGPVDISTIVPTPGQQPAYSFVDLFSNQTITGNKAFSGTNTHSGTKSFSGPSNVTGTLTATSTQRLNNHYYASSYNAADCGAGANVAYAAAAGTKIEVIVDGTCTSQTWPTQIVVPAGDGLYVDQGSYTLTNNQTQAVFINANGYMDCGSRLATVLTETRANTHLVTALSNTQVRNCDLHGTGTAGSASGVNSGSASNVYIHDNILESFGANGINSGSTPVEWRVENNLIRNNLGEGFLYGPNGTQGYIAFNHFTGNTSNGFDLNGSFNGIIGNEADHNGGSGASGLDKDGMISFSSRATSNAINNQWIGNYSHDNNTHGFRWQAGTGGTLQGNVFIGNRSYNNGQGTTPCGNGFVIRNDGANGIVVNNTFVGNSAWNNLGSGAGCADGFAVISSTGAGAFKTTQIIGGQMKTNANWGIEIINANAVDTNVRDVVLTTNTTGPYTDGGTRSRIRGIKNQWTRRIR